MSLLRVKKGVGGWQFETSIRQRRRSGQITFALREFVNHWNAKNLKNYMWHPEMKKEVEWLRSQGTVARYTVEKGQPHRMETLTGANAGRLFDGFEETKKGCKK